MGDQWILYTALNVPTVTPYPSRHCLQWTADGQICFTTKAAVYLLTPDPGINFDADSVITALGPNQKDQNGTKPLGWFRTMIQFVKREVTNWPEHSQAWGAISLGSLDVTLWAVAASPSGISPASGCVIAVLTTNMDLTLWTASKNHLKGEWSMVHHVTPLLLEVDELVPEAHRTLSAQVSSIMWTAQADFCSYPVTSHDGSFLVCGTRAGSLRFLRFDGDKSVRLEHTMPISKRWVTSLSSSQWVSTAQGQCTALIAWADDNGAVGLIAVAQNLVECPGTPLFGLQFDIKCSFEARPLVWEADRRAVTALKWIDIPSRDPILVFLKPGVIYLWSSPFSKSGWSGHRTLLLRSHNICVDSSPLHPVSGVEYIRQNDMLILTLYDGSFHIVHNLATEPALDLPGEPEGVLTDRYLSLNSRAVVARTENVPLTSNDANRIAGMASYDGCSTVVWVHELCRPSDFSYKHDSKHTCMFTTVRMWGGIDDNNALLKNLSYTLNTAKAVSGHVPLSLLRSTFFHLRMSQTRLQQLHRQILDILHPHSVDHNPSIDPSIVSTTDHTIGIEIIPFAGVLDPAVRAHFKQSLAQHLFGWDVLLSLRMRLSLADFCWKLSADPVLQGECGHVAQYLLTTISHRVLRTIIRHLTAVLPVLTANDTAFAMRMVVQSLLPGSPEDLSIEAKNLASLLRPMEGSSEDLTELCPACHVPIELHDITSAMCANGHTWARCSVTSFILTTPFVRTCVGCSRKAYLASSLHPDSGGDTWMPVAARGWVVQSLLEAVYRCLFCGNAFVSVL